MGGRGSILRDHPAMTLKYVQVVKRENCMLNFINILLKKTAFNVGVKFVTQAENNKNREA